MIAAGANVNQAQPDGTTPLHWATYRVDRELVDRLLKRGARANVVNRYGASPLHEAVRVASPELTGILLEAGADANAANEDGMTALMLAARTGNVTVAELLVKAGADVNRRRTVQGTVRRDVGGGREPSGDGGVPVSARAPTCRSARRPPTGRRRSATSRACSTGPSAVSRRCSMRRVRDVSPACKTMVEAGADTDRPNPDGMTPMIMALDNGAPEVAQYLLDRGANPHTWDWWGRTPLYVAVRMRGGVDSRAGRRPPASLAFIKALLDGRGESRTRSWPSRSRAVAAVTTASRTICSRPAPRRCCARRRPSTTRSWRCCSHTARWSIFRTPRV